MISEQIANLEKACNAYENALIKREPLQKIRALRASAAGSLIQLLPFCLKHKWLNMDDNPNASTNFAYRQLITIAKEK